MLKVAILGTAAGYGDAPWEDESYEIWGLNTLYNLLTPWQIKRCSRWFELHPNADHIGVADMASRATDARLRRFAKDHGYGRRFR